MSQHLTELRKEKFGPDSDLDSDFNGPSDPSDAPEGFQVRYGGNSYFITPETAAAEDNIIHPVSCTPSRTCLVLK